MEKTVGEIIRQARLEKGLTVKELFKKLNIDVSSSYMTKIETRGEIPSFKFICQIAPLLGLNARELFEQIKRKKLKDLEDKLDLEFRSASILASARESFILELASR